MRTGLEYRFGWLRNASARGQGANRVLGIWLAVERAVVHADSMRLSRQVQYALCGIFDLAYNGAGGPVRVQTIGARHHIPHRFLEQIFQRLRRAGLVSGKRGPGGGYVLTRRPEEINLRQVLEAIEGPLSARTSSEAEDWPTSGHRPDFLWENIAQRTAAMLAEIAVADICREAARRSIERDLPSGLDYQI